ncbi:MAG: cation-translocating P-type ATPase [Flavobacteriales bacterium]|nr:cation-translocating P-type ATPase [Flavobacteriales bacterium]
MTDKPELTGLTAKEAQERLAQGGANELPTSRRKSALRIALEVMREPMFMLLLACGIIYALLGDYREGMSLLVAIFLIIGITYYQHKRSERALEALRDLSSPRALVVRDGVRVRIAGREVVPGDLVVLAEGDRVPADGVLLSTEGMLVDVSMLTGESVPVHKTAAPVEAGETTAEEHLVHSSTLVTQGQGLARITTTGSGTRIGSIGKAMEAIQDKDTRLQVEMKQLIRTLGIIGIGICVLVVVVFYLTRGVFLNALLAGLSSAIAILPEEFPMVLTVFLALGAWRLSRIQVLTRRPSAIETLGSATVLCADKTGTITQNRMQLVVAMGAAGQEVPVADLAARAIIDEALGHAYLASPVSPFDPMEIAIREAHAPVAEAGGWKNVSPMRDYPFSRGAMMTTRVHQRTGDRTMMASAKGAPEAIIRACVLSVAEEERIRTMVSALADRGLRVIAVASAEIKDIELPEQQTGFTFTFQGLLGLEDPIRPEVPEAMRQCRSAGVRVIMMTGDHPSTAVAIGRKIGLGEDPQVIEGPELERMGDDALRKAIMHTSIFARMVPEQKLRIVDALRANNEVVAMTGDGVNDAPALRAADIGVAMGQKGTDVAREAASLVLLDDNFSSIVSAIRLGRRVYDNLQKSMDFILAVHVPIVGLTLLPAFIPTLPLLLLPMHIVFLELIIDPVCSLVFESQPDERGLMQRPPRPVKATFFGRRAIFSSLLKGLFALLTVVTIYFMSIREGHTVEEVRSIAFAALLLVNLGLIITDLSRSRSLVQMLWRMSWGTRAILSFALLIFVATLFVPWLKQTFSFGYAGWTHYLPSVIGAGCFVVIFEIARAVRSA